jgi:signal transduction histidine kinase
MVADASTEAKRYIEVLSNYLADQSESALYEASLLSEELAVAGFGPDDIVALHMDTVLDVTANEGVSPMQRFRSLEDAQQFLLEVMIGYGVHYKQHMDVILEERQRSQDASARFERERSHLLAAIAHEFGTPLTVASGHTGRARRVVNHEQLPEAADALTEVATALDRLGHLLSDLQHASRSGELPKMSPKPCRVAEVIQQACSWVRADAEQKHIELEFEDELDLPVLADEEALRTVFSNLLSNAVRYTPGGGRVTVRSSRDDEWARIEVRDNGIGMSEETRSRLFEPFYRAPEAEKASPQGLGLGLAITREFVEALDGRIEVVGEPGAGSCFTVFLPLAGNTQTG